MSVECFSTVDQASHTMRTIQRTSLCLLIFSLCIAAAPERAAKPRYQLVAIDGKPLPAVLEATSTRSEPTQLFSPVFVMLGWPNSH